MLPSEAFVRSKLRSVFVPVESGTSPPVGAVLSYRRGGGESAVKPSGRRSSVDGDMLWSGQDESDVGVAGRLLLRFGVTPAAAFGGNVGVLASLCRRFGYEKLRTPPARPAKTVSSGRAGMKGKEARDPFRVSLDCGSANQCGVGCGGELGSTKGSSGSRKGLCRMGWDAETDRPVAIEVTGVSGRGQPG